MADTDKLQQVLNVYDPILKSMDITLFFSQKDKDTVPPNLLLDRINRAATVANLNTNDCKITEFYLTLCSKAIMWWNTLEDNPDVDKGSWADIQKEFLSAYAPRFKTWSNVTQKMFRIIINVCLMHSRKCARPSRP